MTISGGRSAGQPVGAKTNLSSSSSPSSLKVAWLSRALHSYRLPLLRCLAAAPELQVTVFCGTSTQPGVLSPTEALPVHAEWLWNRVLRFRNAQLVRQGASRRLLTGDFDVIICPEVVHNLTVWAVWLLRRIFGKRLVIHGFGYRPRSYSSTSDGSLRNLLRRRLLAGADAIICYTERGRRACIEDGIDRTKIFVSMNTLDTRRLIELGDRVPADQLSALRGHLGIHNDLVLLHVGRLRDFNRVDVLVEAVRELGRRGQRVVLLVIGDGPARSGLQQRAAGLEGVHFLGPIYEEKELALYFALSDLVVRPVRIGLTCVHAFSYGLPVLTASNAVAEQTPEYDYVVGDVNGCIVGSLEPQAFSNAILELIERPDRLAAMKAAARETARGLSIEHMAAEFIAAINSAAGTSRT